MTFPLNHEVASTLLRPKTRNRPTRKVESLGRQGAAADGGSHGHPPGRTEPMLGCGGHACSEPGPGPAAAQGPRGMARGSVHTRHPHSLPAPRAGLLPWLWPAVSVQGSALRTGGGRAVGGRVSAVSRGHKLPALENACPALAGARDAGHPVPRLTAQCHGDSSSASVGHKGEVSGVGSRLRLPGSGHGV